MDRIDPRKGGKGRIAPYETTHVRVPTDIKNIVNALSDEYKTRRFMQGSDGAKRFVDRLDRACTGVCNPLLVSCTALPELDDTVEIAQSILKSKKSAKISLEKLLTILYHQEIKLK